MKKIKLPNRYGDKNYLKEVEPNKYKLVLDSNSGNLRLGFGFIEENQYDYVDPSGGPFMKVGQEIPGVEGVLAEIEVVKGKGIFLIFKT